MDKNKLKEYLNKALPFSSLVCDLKEINNY